MTRNFALALIVPVVALAGAPAVRAQSNHATHPTSAPSSARVPLFAGLGPVHHQVTTDSPKAQKYFDQGLAFIFAFNHDESVRAFKEAARIDPAMAMAYWGIALARGPNINLPQDETAGREAFDAMNKALALKANVSTPEQAYIDALATRYSPDGKASPKLDESYANAMRQLKNRYPDDMDAQVLFAESMMDLRPWQLWFSDGKPAPGTEEIVQTLELVLGNQPDHVGANHYYIHAVEASPRPQRALPSANRLGKLVPAAGHLVHMPSHIYIRTGRYDAGARSNEAAIIADRKYIESQKPAGVYPLMYANHNIHFLWACRLAQGNKKASLAAAGELIGSVPEDAVRQMPMVEFMVPTTLFTQARFAMWDDILAAPPPPKDFRYTAAIRRYARGLALLAKRKAAEAAAELKQLDSIAVATPPDAIVGFNKRKDLLALASALLAGQIASKEGRRDDALKDLRRAVTLQDHLIYEEPPAWYYPVRQTLAVELVQQGKLEEAEVAYREDLMRNPENGVSLNGLATTLRARGKPDEAAKVDLRLKKAWANADVPPDL
ncbi:MAG: tetratricopeptide repeat protein, partial [Candidatus Binataceae bacterium]